MLPIPSLGVSNLKWGGAGREASSGCGVAVHMPGYNGYVLRFATLASCALTAHLWAQTSFFPLQEVKPGMRGTGKTVFSGNQVEEFQVEVLGVLNNVGPKESLVLARLSGGPLAHTGVMQGMSGSPVYIGGKLLGAVARSRRAWATPPISNQVP